MSLAQRSGHPLPERRPVLTLLSVAGACILLGAAGGLLTAPQIETWYAALDKPAFNPPSWVFGPVWTTLYTLMGVAAWLVWRAGLDRRAVKSALGLFTVQLALNLAWTPAFFGLESPLLGLAVIVPLWVAIALTITVFSRIDWRAAALLVPYLAWVSFATVLNYAIWTLN